MKKIFKFLMVGIFLMPTFAAHSQGLGDLLNGLGGKGGTGNILSNVIEGVFTKSNLSLADLVGEYTSTGPAVTFKSENLLQKAGGIAGAATIESKLQPYYEKYGLIGMTLSVDKDANFIMKIKGISLKGTISKNDSDGTFDFNFNVAGIKLGKFTAYIEKSGSNLKLMFDATKLKSFISTVANFTGNSMAQAVGSILDSYDGACIGWKMVSNGASGMSSGNPSNSNDSSSSNGLNSLLDLLKGNKK